MLRSETAYPNWRSWMVPVFAAFLTATVVQESQSQVLPLVQPRQTEVSTQMAELGIRGLEKVATDSSFSASNAQIAGVLLQIVGPSDSACSKELEERRSFFR